GIYNATDDAPSPAEAVIRHAAARLGLPLPPQVDLDDPSISDAMRRFYLDNKRVSNARAKAELGWRPAYPSWREGLEAVLAAD
ncbi:MAG: SDR family NAD(P)-dependent oxidoreductase, partial [Brevundimonas sp.]